MLFCNCIMFSFLKHFSRARLYISTCDAIEVFHIKMSFKNLTRWASKRYWVKVKIQSKFPFFSPSVHLFVRPSVRTSVCPSVGPSVSVCLSVTGADRQRYDTRNRSLVTTTTTSLFLTLNIQISHHLQIARLIEAGGGKPSFTCVVSFLRTSNLYSILFYSFPFNSIPFHPTPSHPILFCSSI